MTTPQIGDMVIGRTEGNYHHHIGFVKAVTPDKGPPVHVECVFCDLTHWFQVTELKILPRGGK